MSGRSSYLFRSLTVLYNYPKMSGSPTPTCTHNDLVTATIITALGDNMSHLAVEYHDLVIANPNRSFEPVITVSTGRQRVI